MTPYIKAVLFQTTFFQSQCARQEFSRQNYHVALFQTPSLLWIITEILEIPFSRQSVKVGILPDKKIKKEFLLYNCIDKIAYPNITLKIKPNWHL